MMVKRSVRLLKTAIVLIFF